MSDLLKNEDWDVLLTRIRDGKCTPFLGAGASYGRLPLGGEIAEQWAVKYQYPLKDSSNLVSVAQFLALKYSDSLFPKERIVEMFSEKPSEAATDPYEPHRVLATLPLPVYITTNYDDFMVQALKRRNRDPKRVLCRWNQAVKDYVEDHPSIFETDPGFKPNVANPVVFHLHGYVPIAESLVLTEDDYMDFLLRMSTDEQLIPAQVSRALTGSSLLFIGYRITDWNFRVLLKSFERSYTSRRLNIAVMPPPSASQSSAESVQDYMTKYYQNIDARVYWGTASEFVKELKERWDRSGFAV